MVDFVLEQWVFGVNTILLFLALIIMVNVTRVIREYSQGMDYDLAYSSSRLGDPALIAMACYAIDIIQRHGRWPDGFDGNGWRMASLLLGIIVATIWMSLVFFRDRIAGLIADTYHNTVVVLAIVFFSFTCVVPVVFSPGYATQTQWWVLVCLFGTWLASLAFDIWDGRIPHQFAAMERNDCLRRQQKVIDNEKAAKEAAKQR